MQGDGCQSWRNLHFRIHTIVLLSLAHQGIMEWIASAMTLANQHHHRWFNSVLCHFVPFTKGYAIKAARKKRYFYYV